MEPDVVSHTCNGITQEPTAKKDLGYRVRLCLKKIIINNTLKQKEKHLGRGREIVETAAKAEESKEEGR